MIKLITDGGLPHPARCCSCGYAGNERFYFWFKYKEKWGQVLICTTCMNEAALLDETGFVSVETSNAILEQNFKLRAENDRLELATERFTDKFAGLVTEFLHDLSGALPHPVEEESNTEPPPPDPEPEFPRAGEVVVERVDAVVVDDIFEATSYSPRGRLFPEADLESL